jgi:hypothetical protein
MKRFAWLLLLPFLIAIIATVSCRRNNVPASRMEPQLRFYGFSVARPPNTGWFALMNEQKDDVAIFRKKLSSNTHTAFVSIELRKMNRPATSLEDLVTIDKETHIFQDTVRFKMLDFTQTPNTRQGQWCVYWTEQVIDRKPAINPNIPLVARAYGFRCIHPIYKQTVALVAEISERGLEEELDPSIMTEGEAILKSIVLVDTLGVPFQ